jgi:hypothetical protein
MREAQRKRNEERVIQAQAQSQRASIDKETPASPTPSTSTSTATMDPDSRPRASIDMTQAQASVSAASQKAGAYFSSWGSWASEKRREWQDKRSASPSPNPNANANSNANATPSPSTAAGITSPSASTLSVVTEIAESDRDRGRRRSIQHKSEGSIDSTTEGGLARSVSRRKRWSNILLRRDSGEFQRRDESSTSESADMPFPKSPLSQGFPAYGEGVEEKKENQDRDQGDDPQIHTQEKVERDPDTIDADGFSSVALTPNEGLGLDMNQNPSRNQKENMPPSGGGHTRDKSLTALPVKEDV